MAHLACVAIALTPSAPAFADIVAAKDGGGAQLTDTTISVNSTTHHTTVTTGPGSVADNVAINAFSRFSIAPTESATVVQPSGTDFLINIVDDASGNPASINGTLDFTKAGDAAGVNSSSVFFLDHNGMIVGNAGRINANTLVLSTATRGFGQRLLARDGAAISSLRNGTEELAPNAQLEFASGSVVSVRALELHAGGNLVLDGTIRVSDPDASGTTAPRPAVNTNGLAQASGANVQGGVIFFGAGGTARVGGRIEAQRGSAGGQIVGRSGGNMTVQSGAVLDVSGAAHDAGLIFLKTGGDYAIDRTPAALIANPAIKLDIQAGAEMLAASTGGKGGFVYASAPDVDLAARLGLGGATRGEALVYAQHARLTGDTQTQGGDLTVIGDWKVDVLTGAEINTAGGGSAGDLTLVTQGQINVASGAKLLADAAGAGNGGLVGLIARRVTAPAAWRPTETYDADVSINLTGATLKAGAIIVSATARADNTVNDSNADAVEADAQSASTTRSDGTTVPTMQAAMDEMIEQAKDAARRGRDSVLRKLPIDMKNSSASAQISITSSTLTARGNWARSADLPAQTPARIAENGYLTPDGVVMRDYDLVSHALAPRSTRLPVSFDPSKSSLYIHADAQTHTNVKPITKALSLGQSVTDTKATVRIESSDLLAMEGDVQLAATLHDNVNVALAGRAGGRAGAAALISRQNSIAQLLVLGGTTTATTGDLRAAALTGKSLHHANTLTAGRSTRVATAVSIALGRSFTEASIGGTISAGAVDLDAETILFKKRYETVVNMGGTSSAPTTTAGNGSNAAAQGGQQSATGVLGSSASQASAGGRSFGLAVDIQIDRHQSYASLGGAYRDLTASQAIRTHAPTTVTARDAVTVDAQQRFARYLEGGRAMSRKVQTNVTSGSAMVTSFSLSQMQGAVRAEIGANATVTADSVAVRGLTEYQTTAQLTNFKQRLQLFRDQLSGVAANGLTSAQARVMPDVNVSSVDDPRNNLVFLTSLVGNKSASGTAPGNTMGMTLNMFETDNSTEAAILDGASITSRNDLNVTARQEAVFTHFGSDRKKGRAALGTDGSAAPMIGANVTVPRMTSRVVAHVGDATIRATGDVLIDARNDVVQLGAVRAGGSAQQLAFSGAVAANVFETTTLAKLGARADLRADELVLRAVDDSMLVSVAGANSSSAGKSAGVSAVINIVRRNTRAGIGLDAPAGSTSTSGNIIQTTSLRIDAANTGFVMGAAIAGSKTAGAAAGGAPTNDQPSVPAGMLSTDETAAVNANASSQTRAGATGGSGGFGLALSASTVLNLLEQNDTQASLITGGQVTTNNAVTVQARNSATAMALAGGGAMGRGGTASLAGAAAVYKDARNTRVQLRDARLTAASLTAQAQDQARAISLAMGGSIMIAGRAAIAGSVATQLERGETKIDIASNRITADQMNLDADNDGRLIAFAGAVSVATGGTPAAAGLSAVVNKSSRDAAIALSGATIEAQNSAALTAQNRIKSYGIAASGSLLANVALAGASAVNTVEGSAKISLDSSKASVAAGDLTVLARSATKLQAYAGNAAIAAKVGIGPALAINLNEGGAQTLLRGTGTRLSARDVQIQALDEGELAGRALALSAGSSAAAAIGIVTNTANMRIINDIQGSDVLARRNIVIRARSTGGFSGLALAVAGAGSTAVTGSATTNKATNTVSTVVRGNTASAAPQRALILAKGTVALLSEARNTITLKGGGSDKLLSATGGLAVGATAGAGGVVSVNLSQNTVETKVLSGGYDATQVQGFGAHTLTLDGTARRGVVIASVAKTDLNIWSMSAAASAGLGATGLVVVNKVADVARSQLGDGKAVEIGTIGSLSTQSSDAALLAALQVINGGALLEANELNSTTIDAKIHSEIHSYAMSVGIGGKLGAGGTVVTNQLSGSALILAQGAQITGEASVALRANAVTEIDVMSVGVAGGKFAGSASFAYNSISTTSRVDLIGAPITARGRAPASAGAPVLSTGDVLVDAATQNTINGALIGSAAVGAGAGTGAVVVNVLANTTEVSARGLTAQRRVFDQASAAYVIRPVYLASTLSARGDVSVLARTHNSLQGRAVSGAIGGAAGAVSVAVDLITSRTTVRIGADQKIEGKSVALRANETTSVTPTVGAVAGGAGAGAGSLSYLDFGGNSSVFVGDNVEIIARGDLAIEAKALRIVDAKGGAAALGSVAINGVISLIRMGGVTTDASGVGANILGLARSDMGRTTADGGRSGAPVGSLDNLTARAGAQSTITAVNADQKARALVIDAVRTDNVGVVIGASAKLRSDANITIEAKSQSDLTQTVGSASLGFAGIAAAVGSVKLASTATIEMRSNAQVISDKVIRIAAETGGRPLAGGPTHAVTSKVYALGGGVIAAVGAGVSLVENQSRAQVVIADGAILGTTSALSTPNSGDVNDATQKLQISARRSGAVRANILNITASGGAAVGVTIAKVINTGTAGVSIGTATGSATQLKSGDLAITASDETAAQAATLSAAGGTLAGMSGAFARVVNSGATAVTLQRVRANALRFGLTNASTARASAEARGLALGALAVGVMLTEAELNSTLTTTLSGVAITADLVSITTQLSASAGNENAKATSISGSGGIVAGAGASAIASSAYSVRTNISGGADAVVATNLNGRFGVIIANKAMGAHTSATASGKSAGLVAIGAVLAEAGQRGTRQALVVTDIASGRFASRGRVEVVNENRQLVSVNVTSGAGGLVAGSGSSARSFVSAVTRINTGTAGATQLLAGDLADPESTRLNGAVALTSRQDSVVTNQVDNRSASLVGVSVARSRADISVDTSVTVGGQTELRGNDFSVISHNRVKKSGGVLSDSGGLATGGGVTSSVRVAKLAQSVTLADGANLTQIGDPDLASANRIGATATLKLEDSVTIDAKGAGVLPQGASDIGADQESRVTIGRANVVSQGELRIYSGARVQISSTAYATASGAAGLAFSQSVSNYNAKNIITIAAGANLLSFTGISIHAGSAGAGDQRIDVNAEARVFNRTAVPLVSSPVAVASTDIYSHVNIEAGANVIAYEDVNLSATKGRVTRRGFATSKDFYKEIIGKVASAAGVSLVLETKKESGESTGAGSVDINGQVRAGAFNRWVLYFDETDQVANGRLETEAQNGVFELPANAPPASTYSVRRNVDIAADVQAEIDKTQARIADPNTSADDVARLRAHLGVLSRRKAELAGVRATVITAGGLRASEGSVRISADTLTGASTGLVGAAGEADIRIYVSSGAMLEVTDLTITDIVGGDVTFNGTRLAAGVSAYGFTVDLAPQADGRNKIEVVNQGRAGGSTSAGDRGDIIIVGNSWNASGDVSFRTDLGSIMQRGYVDGVNTELSAVKGSLSVAPIAGVDNKGASPQIVNSGYMNAMESLARTEYQLLILSNGGGNVSSHSFVRNHNVYVQPRPTASIVAGKDIVLLAEYTNINTTISAGTGAYKVRIGAGIDTLLTQLRSTGGSGRVRLINTYATGPSTAIRTAEITRDTNAEIYFNYDTGQLEIDNMRVRGGGIYIVSNVISTGNGVLRAVDGFGSVDINSQSTFDVVLKGIDLGGRADGTGLAGLIQITDLSRRSTTLDPTRSAPGAPVYMPLITRYRSLGGTVTETNNNITASGGAGYDHATGTPLNVVGTYATPASGVRPALNYNPVAGRDYVVRTEVVRLIKMEQFDINIVKGNHSWVKDMGRDLGLTKFYRWDRLGNAGISEAGIVVGSERTLIDTTRRPQILGSIAGAHYDYRASSAFNTVQLTSSTATGYYIYNRDGALVHIGADSDLRELMLATPAHPNANVRMSKVNNSRFEEVANIYPQNQSLYSLIYELNPNPGISQHELNQRHKIFDRRIGIFAEREYHEHRFNASKPISIQFSASNTRNSTIVTAGNVIFGSNFTNRYSDTSVTSTAGSILTANDRVTLSTSNLSLSAAQRIGGVEGAMRLDMTADTNSGDAIVTPAVLTASAGTQIDIAEVDGDLHFGAVSTTARNTDASGAQQGAISLRAAGNLIQQAGAPAITGSSITLNSDGGSIYQGTPTTALDIDTQGGRFSADAQGTVRVRETVGDMGIGLVETDFGDVILSAPNGRIVDRNNFEVRDTRTETELADLWTRKLGLIGGTAELAAREQRHIQALKDRVAAQYQLYWSMRMAAGGAPQVFELDPTLLEKMRKAQPDRTIIDDYIARNKALYALWNAQSAFDSSYVYVPSAAELAELRQGSAWTLDELRGAVRSDLILETGDTKLRIEAANIKSGRNIVLSSGQGIGQISAPYVLRKPGAGGRFSARDLAILALADEADFDIDGDEKPDVDADGNTLIRQEEDLNFELKKDGNGVVIGTISATVSANEIYLAAESSARIERIAGPGQVELRLSGAMIDAGGALPAVRGRQIVLESGLDAAIGTAAAPVRVNVLSGGTLSVRSGTRAYVHAPRVSGGTGDLPVLAAFAKEKLRLSADGAIFAAGSGNVERVISPDIELRAASIGTAARALGIRQPAGPDRTAQLTALSGGIYVFTASDLKLGAFSTPAGGSLTTLGTAALDFSSATLSRFGASDSFTLNLNGAVTSGGTTPLLTGGHLIVRSNSSLGTQALPLRVSVSDLTIGAVALPTNPEAIWLHNTGALTVRNLGQSSFATAQAHVHSTGNLQLNGATAGGIVTLSSDANIDITSANVRQLALQVGGTIGTGSAMALNVRQLELQALSGSATLALSGGTTVINRANIGHDLTITATGAGLTLAGQGLAVAGQTQITTDRSVDVAANSSHTITRAQITAQSLGFAAGARLQARGEFALTSASLALAEGAELISDTQLSLDISNGLVMSDSARLTSAGALRATVAGDVQANTGSVIEASSGALALTVGGDAQLARVVSGAAGDAALSLTIAGSLTASAPAEPTLIANQTGALTTLRLGSLPAAGQGALRVSLARLDATVAAGDLHILETDDLIIENAQASAGTADIFAAQSITLRNIMARDVAVVAAGAGLMADAAQIQAPKAYLFALGGEIAGETGLHFTADAASGAQVHLMAEGDVRYAETSGDAHLGYAISRTGSADIAQRAAGGALRIDRLGAANSLRLSALGSTDIRQIGGAALDPIDEQSLSLAYFGATPYGPVAVLEPQDLVVTAAETGSEIKVAGLRARRSVSLQADRIAATIEDISPEDGLDLTLTGTDGGMASSVTVEVTTPSSAVRINKGRFETGTIRVAGPSLTVKDVIIGNAAWFHQRGFELYATNGVGAASRSADAQLIAIGRSGGQIVKGRVAFALSGEADLRTDDLVLRRAALDIIVNDVRPFSAEILLELIETLPLAQGTSRPETLSEEFEKLLQILRQIDAGEGEQIQLPMIMASAA